MPFHGELSRYYQKHFSDGDAADDRWRAFFGLSKTNAEWYDMSSNAFMEADINEKRELIRQYRLLEEGNMVLKSLLDVFDRKLDAIVENSAH